MRHTLGRFLNTYGLPVMLGVLASVFIAVNPAFLSLENFRTLIEQNAALAIIAVGMTFAVISRNIDLAPGSFIALTGVVIGLVFSSTGNIVVGVACGLIAALALDVFNGLLIAKVKLDPLIVTLAAWIWARGLAISLTKANSIVIRDPFLEWMAGAQVIGISPPMMLAALAFAMGAFVLNRTRLGRYVRAIGGDERAAIQAGIDTTRYKVILFALLGVLVWVAALITLSRLGAAAPDAAYGIELDAIVAVIIGGTPFAGGEGSIRRTLFGVLFIAILNNGLSTLGMRDAYFFALKGATILLALSLEVLSRRLLKGEALSYAQ